MKFNSTILFFTIISLTISTMLVPLLPAPLHATSETSKNKTNDNKASTEDNRVRAKIGIQIQSGEKVFRARSRERLRAGDLLRLYVHAEKSCYIYIIHTDKKNVNLLNITEQKIQSSTLILPSAQAFYEIDGKSSMEKFTIICTPAKLPSLSKMERTAVSYADWSTMEAALLKKSNILISDEEHQPFAIAGNVRGGGSNSDAFLRELQIFSGKNLLVKTYEFKIKK